MEDEAIDIVDRLKDIRLAFSPGDRFGEWVSEIALDAKMTIESLRSEIRILKSPSLSNPFR